MVATTWGTPAGPSTTWAPMPGLSSLSTYNTVGAATRTSVGLLAWSLQSSENDGSIASRRTFVDAQWDANGKSANNNFHGIGPDGLFGYYGPAFNLSNVLLNTSVDSRVTYLVQARCANIPSAGDLVCSGPAVRCEATGRTGTSTVSAIRFTYPASTVTRNLGVEEIRADVSVTSSLVSYLSPTSTLQRSVLWANGTNAAGFDFVSRRTSAVTLAVQNLSARPGLAFGDATGGNEGNMVCAEWLVCTDRYVRVTGPILLTNYVVAVRRSGGSIMASASVANSAASIDMLSVVLDGAHTELAVYDSQNSLFSVTTITSPGIWPGDIYSVATSLSTLTLSAGTWSAVAPPSTTWAAFA